MIRKLACLIWVSTCAFAAAADTWPATRDAYLAKSEAKLKPVAGLPDEFWAWLDAHPDIRAGLLAASPEPDPAYARNLALLRKEIGAPSAERYLNLLLAVSLQPAITPPVPPAKQPDPLVDALAALMRSRNLTLPQLVAQADVLTKEAGITLPAKRRDAIWDRLALATHTYPERTPAPLVDFIRGLIARQDTKLPRFNSGPQWPLFPLDRAPWPLLLPMRQAVPPDEVDFIWKRFTGATPVPNGKRLQTYGRYSWDYEKPEVKYKTSQWHPSALPRIIEDGGVCGRLSTLGQTSVLALGQPAMGLYQPGHRAFLSYDLDKSGKRFVARQQQSITGPLQSTDPWFLPGTQGLRVFGKHGEERVGIEYHIGLALAMNHGLDRFVDSLIAIHLARMQTADRLPEKIRLLEFAIARNPFAVEAWYALADTHDYDMTAINRLLVHLDATLGVAPPEAAFALPADTDFNQHAADQPVATDQKADAATLASILAPEILQHAYQHAFARIGERTANLRLLRAEMERRAALRAPYGEDADAVLMHYQAVVEGVAPLQIKIEDEIKAALAEGKPRRRTKLLQEHIPVVRAVAEEISNPEQRAAWLGNLRALVPAELRFTKSENGAKPDKFYAAAYEQQLRALRALGKSGKPQAAELQKSFDAERDAVK